jgi:hypothetical protein
VSKPDNNPRDPRYRPFRVAMYAIYLTAVGIISLLVVNSVLRSVIRMTPAHKPPAEHTLTARECLDAADELWGQMERERRGLTEQKVAHLADDHWSEFRVSWLERKRDLESKCALESRNREPLKKVYARLERVMDLYTIHATQYAGEIGLSVDALRESMKVAREDASK